MQTTPAGSPSELSELARCCAVFPPSTPARTGRIGFRRPDGEASRAVTDPVVAHGSPAELDIVMLTADGRVEPVRRPALLLPVHRGAGGVAHGCGAWRTPSWT